MNEDSPTPILEVTDLKKHFPVESGLLSRITGTGEVIRAVDGVTFAMEAGETLGVVGESGCGKTTLAKTILQLVTPTSGSIQFDGTELTALAKRELRDERADMQMIFQDPHSAINPRRTVGYSIGKPLEIHHGLTGEQKRSEIKSLLQEVGLKDDHVDRYPHQFSGGQLQRVGIARALAVDPTLIIADEPVSALDASVKAKILNLLADLQRRHELSYVVIGHDLKTMNHLCDRIAVMYLGEIVEIGSTEEVFANPQHPYTRALLEEIPSIEGPSLAPEGILKDEPPSPQDPPSGCRFHPRCPEYIGDVCKTTPPDSHVADRGTGGRQKHQATCHLLDDERSEEV